MAIKNHRDLLASQTAMELVVAVYEVAEKMPSTEAFGLAGQMRRAVVSVAVNIAEGEGRRSPREFRRYLRIAHGSVREVETEVLIAIRLGFAPEAIKKGDGISCSGRAANQRSPSCRNRGTLEH